MGVVLSPIPNGSRDLALDSTSPRDTPGGPDGVGEGGARAARSAMAMKDRKLASRYARALLDSLPDPAAAEKADGFLHALCAALEESPDFHGVMFDPAVPRPIRRQVLRSIAEQNGMSHQVGNFLVTVVDHGRTGSLPAIAAAFHEEREARLGIVPAEVTTAWPLTEELKQRTLAVLEKMTGSKVRLTTLVDPGLIGGALTRIGSEVHDGSLRGQLERLRHRMMQE